jgi:TonB family protein
MKHLLLLITLTAAYCTQSFSQTDTLWFDRSFKPTSKKYAVYYRPAPAKEGNNYRVLDYYKSGKLQGSALSAYPDKDFWVGNMYGFFENGDTLFVAGYKNGLPDGETREYYYGGKKRRTSTFINGLQHGVHTEYYSNGEILGQATYANGVPHGNFTSYSSKGKLRTEYNFSEGKLHGKYFSKTYSLLDFERKDEMKFIGNFANGNLIDYQMYFHGQKKPRVTARDENGVEHWKFYTGDTLILECYYKNNKRTGEWKRYSPDGKAIAEIITYNTDDTCTDQQPVDIKEIKNGVVLPKRFGGIIEDLYMDCTNARFKRFDKSGKVIADTDINGMDEALNNVPYELQYPELEDFYTFYINPMYNENTEILRGTEIVVEEEPTVVEAPVVEEPKVFTIVEQMPEFPGGDDALWKYLKASFVYPPKAVELAIEGKVLVRFVIHADGKVGDVTVLRGLQKDIDAEAVRLVKSLPAFKPGRQQGKPVAVYFNLPVPVKIK